MKITRAHSIMAVAVLSLLALGAGPVSDAAAQGERRFEVSLLGGLQVLNENDTALPDRFLNVPAVAGIAYHIDRVWTAEAELMWMIPVKQEVELAAGGVAERLSPDLLSYQANLRARLPLGGSAWSPYVTAGAGAVTFLSSTEEDRLPQLPESQTAFAINFGIGTTYALGGRWALRADLRELAAFPSKSAEGLARDADASSIWMERATVGVAYGF